MPELPEVETTRRGLAPHLEGQRVTRVVLRRPDLRWPIPIEVQQQLPGQTILSVRRRAKYLLFDTTAGSALLHLGMSGTLRIVAGEAAIKTHDHVDILLDNDKLLRFNDPRRFGCLLWQPTGQEHPLLQHLGPEPLSDDFNADYLFFRSRQRQTPVKSWLMDQRLVVGVGNIYAAEALFIAGISPLRMAGKLSRKHCEALAAAIKHILAHAITRGGTTLRDFLAPDGAPGYFEQELLVYGRNTQPCRHCKTPLQNVLISGRASVWCKRCQK